MKKKFLLWIASISLLFAFSGNAYAKCGEVTITEMNWASASVVTAVAKFMMEQGYGCKVAVVPTSTIPAVTSVAETGEPDILTEIWFNAIPAYSKLEKEGKIKTLTNVLSDGGEDRWWIPKYLADKHPELKTIEGVLKNPKLVGGKFHNCPVGWACRTINDNLIKAFELEKNNIEIFNHGSGETLATSIASAYAEKAPWFGYYWGPTAILGKYAMVSVDLGKFNAEYHACNSKPDCATPGKSPYKPARVVTGATTDFIKKMPEIAELMSKLSFTNAVMGSLLAWKQDNQASNEETAVYFIQKYPNVWKSWLNKEAKAKLSKLIQ